MSREDGPIPRISTQKSQELFEAQKEGHEVTDENVDAKLADVFGVLRSRFKNNILLTRFVQREISLADKEINAANKILNEYLDSVLKEKLALLEKCDQAVSRYQLELLTHHSSSQSPNPTPRPGRQELATSINNLVDEFADHTRATYRTTSENFEAHANAATERIDAVDEKMNRDPNFSSTFVLSPFPGFKKIMTLKINSVKDSIAHVQNNFNPEIVIATAKDEALDLIRALENRD